MKNDTIASSLGIVIDGEIVSEECTDITTTKKPAEIDKVARDDIEFARSNLRDLIDMGNEAAATIANLAEQSQNPRAYEILGTFLKQMVEANRDLVELHKQKKDIIREKKDDDDKSVVNNNLFVGSTSQLLEMIENARK